MNTFIAAFKSRRDAILYSEAMLSRGVAVKVIATPSLVGSSCGLSVRFQQGAARIAERVLSAGEYPSFLGFFRA